MWLFSSTSFDNTQLLLLGFGAFFFVLSMVMQLSNRPRFSFAFLGLTAFFIFSFAAVLDPFLNLWDERFHALVAKNLMNHPLMPTLYDDPIVDIAYDRWDRYHIWLHKQPLFLWQIALSFKLFGVSEFALRLPSVLLGTILVLITCRSGKLLFNERVGYAAGLLLISTIYIIELVAGRQELEHNDISFLTYISLSVWSFIEYHYSKNKVWIYLIGLFSGMAILCKWLVGLLVYFGWLVLRVMQKKFRLAENKDLLISLLVTAIIFLPWQLLTFLWYPTEATHAYQLNALHFTTPIEGHGGGFYYHFEKFNVLYGPLASFFIVPALVIFWRKGSDKQLLATLLSMVIVVYLFFSIAATKMPSFTIVVAMLVCISFAALFDFLLLSVTRFFSSTFIRLFVFIIFISMVAVWRFDIKYLQEKYSLKQGSNHYSDQMIHNKKVFESLELSPNTVLFNVKGRHYVEAMFYTELPAYNFIPTLEQYKSVKEKGRDIAVFHSGTTPLPHYLLNDPAVTVLHQEIQGYK